MPQCWENTVRTHYPQQPPSPSSLPSLFGKAPSTRATGELSREDPPPLSPPALTPLPVPYLRWLFSSKQNPAGEDIELYVIR